MGILSPKMALFALFLVISKPRKLSKNAIWAEFVRDEWGVKVSDEMMVKSKFRSEIDI